ncbi:hypothetical protein NHQ30_005245 [Ciborinia camelliae]|nr:hypothetical protein NHQ30_005245 [Ciborinia camelliae]
MSNLDHFSRLAPSIHIHEPETTTSLQNQTTKSTAPDLILICAWLNASLKHISKYTTAYESLYPTSRILVITTSTTDTLATSSSNLARVQPALEILYKLPGDSKILIHSFSNGGAFTMTTMAREYAGKSGVPIPITAMILDSSPGKFHYHATIRAFSVGLPKNPLIHFPCVLLLHIMLGAYKTYHGIMGKIDVLERARRDLNDERFFGKEAKRAYIYSEGDQMVEWRDVEEHADEAGKLGYGVLKERFGETGHTGHLMGDRERYLGVVRKLGDWDQVV